MYDGVDFGSLGPRAFHEGDAPTSTWYGHDLLPTELMFVKVAGDTLHTKYLEPRARSEFYPVVESMTDWAYGAQWLLLLNECRELRRASLPCCRVTDGVWITHAGSYVASDDCKALEQAIDRDRLARQVLSAAPVRHGNQLHVPQFRSPFGADITKLGNCSRLHISSCAGHEVLSTLASEPAAAQATFLSFVDSVLVDVASL
jgi:hypothetical protein